jgi:osmotically-inducible protein OsmY
MKSDFQIQKDVMEELSWDPSVSKAGLGVAVKDGVVTLSGQVESYAQKLAAERDAKKISGVRAVAEDILVGMSPTFKRTDAEIAKAVLDALLWHSFVIEDKIKIKVEDGIVTLEGEVEWEYQRNSAQIAIQDLTGVKSVRNLILIKPKVVAADISDKITKAFERSATVDARNIKVEVIGTEVFLSGTVRSFTEKQNAADAAWNAPGVSNVRNNLKVGVKEYPTD